MFCILDISLVLNCFLRIIREMLEFSNFFLFSCWVFVLSGSFVLDNRIESEVVLVIKCMLENGKRFYCKILKSRVWVFYFLGEYLRVFSLKSVFFFCIYCVCCEGRSWSDIFYN